MNRTLVTSLFCGLLTFLIVFSFVVGCSDDIVLEPLPSLLGEYRGVYVYVEKYGTGNDQPDDPYEVIVRFSDQYYWVFDNFDSLSERCICEPSGSYILADGVDFTQVVPGCASCIFDDGKLPAGNFSLRRPTDPNTGIDSLVLTQLVVDTYKELQLIPVEY